MNITSVELIEPIWERQPGESGDWFRRFCRYRNQIGKRTLIGAVRAEAEENGVIRSIKKPPGSWQVARQKWRWEERVAAWDEHQQAIQDFEWDERFKQFRQNCWEDYEVLRQKSQSMLRMPVVTQTVTRNDGGLVVTTINAVDWHQFMPAVNMLKLSVLLAEKAIGNLSIAATLLDSAGFTVNNPKVAEVANDFLDGGGLDV